MKTKGENEQYLSILQEVKVSTVCDCCISIMCKCARECVLCCIPYCQFKGN